MVPQSVQFNDHLLRALWITDLVKRRACRRRPWFLQKPHRRSREAFERRGLPHLNTCALEGDRADAQSLVREAWRYDNFSGELEAQILDVSET